MSRYIDAEELKRAKFHPLPYPHITPSDVEAESYKRGWNDAIDAVVDNEPTADVRENVRGEWIDEPVYKQTMDGKTWDGFTYCSECKEIHEYGYRSKFCPNCGADMKGGQHEKDY